MKIKFVNLISVLLVLATVFSLAAASYVPAPPDETKTGRLRWKNVTINVALSTSLTKPSPYIKSDSDVLSAVRRSLATWEKVANVKFNEVSSEKQSVSPAGNAGDGVSLITVAPAAENLLLFAADAAEVSAKTRAFYNHRGTITEADIVLNPYAQFSTDGTIGTFDLEATITHEIGHLLGLEHSPVVGSTMQTHQGKNGIYNLPQTASRTLSDSDIANVRALYGPAEDVEDCCGTAKGKLTLAATAASGFQVWLEEKETGRIQAGTVTAADGTFVLEGLSTGRYLVYAQDSGDKQKNRKQIYSGAEIDEIVIEKGKITQIEKQIVVRERTFSAKYIGFNGQISNIPIPVNAGKSFVIYVGGDNLNPNDLVVSTNSPFIKVVPNTTASHDFGEKISVLSFEVSIKPNAPAGEFSIKVQKQNGETGYFVGGIINDAVSNPWSSAQSANFD